VEGNKEYGSAGGHLLKRPRVNSSFVGNPCKVPRLGRCLHAVRSKGGLSLNRRHQKRQNSEHQMHLRDLRRGQADTAEQVAKSKEAIEDSLALLQRSDRMRVAQEPGIRRRPDATKKTRPSR